MPPDSLSLNGRVLLWAPENRCEHRSGTAGYIELFDPENGTLEKLKKIEVKNEHIVNPIKEVTAKDGGFEAFVKGVKFVPYEAPSGYAPQDDEHYIFIKNKN